MTPTLTLLATLTMTATPAPTRIGIIVEFMEQVTPSPSSVAIQYPKVVGHWYIYEQNGWRWVEDDRTGAPVTMRHKIEKDNDPIVCDGHEWVLEGPFYLAAANSCEEPQYYPPGALIKIQFCKKCGLMRLPQEYRKFDMHNMASGEK